MKIYLIALSLLAAALAFADDPPAPTPESAAPAPVAYPIDYCLVSGEKLGGMGEPAKYTHEGREIQFCCPNCIASFQKEPAKYLAQLDSAIVSVQSRTYPLTTCVVSGEPLGSMGEPYNYIYNNRLVEFCCGSCVATFNKEPDKYLKMIDAAYAKAPLREAPAPQSN